MSIKLNFDLLDKPRSTNGGGDFGNLTAGISYKLQITAASLGLSKKAQQPMVSLTTKTVSGDTGVGTYIRKWYMLKNDSPQDLNVFVKLLDATGLKEEFITSAGDDAAVQDITAKLVGKEFYAVVGDDGEWNGKKQWTFNAWGVSKHQSVIPDVTTQDLTPETQKVETTVEDLGSGFPSFDLN